MKIASSAKFRLIHVVRRYGQVGRVVSAGWLRKQLLRRCQGAKTCNLSVWRDDLLQEVFVVSGRIVAKRVVNQ